MARLHEGKGVHGRCPRAGTEGSGTEGSGVVHILCGDAQRSMLIGGDGVIGGSGRGGSGRTSEEEKEEGKVFSDGIPAAEAQARVQMKEKRERLGHLLVPLPLPSMVSVLRVAPDDNHSYVFRVSGSLEHFPQMEYIVEKVVLVTLQ